MTRRSKRGKEKEKVEKYQHLKREIGRLWGLKMVEIVPVATRALGSAANVFDGWIEKLLIKRKGCIVGNCKNIEKKAGDVKKRSFC